MVGIQPVGELLPLDLVNTRANGPDTEVDTLDALPTFHAWLAAQDGRLSQPDEHPTEADRDTVRAVRAHVEAAVEHARQGTRPAEGVLRALTEAQRAAPAYRELDWDGEHVAAAIRRDGDYGTRIAAELAEATAVLLASPAARKIRRCEGPGCRMLFLPAHPKRRWCSPTLCGNRVRVARHYQRQKAESPESP
ncbi:hypothetical protein F0L68_26055 [Solihabitans fulvus]|uniref:Zinc finger CGNR domain-containing protein n=1 Tax=Solihabitans fulvus TaxID=1892852 RepID=A0A5B2WYS1_9PSEU|nr:hypothetical protein F0L68_26055 [Solihabitans fulvus]